MKFDLQEFLDEEREVPVTDLRTSEVHVFAGANVFRFLRPHFQTVHHTWGPLYRAIYGRHNAEVWLVEEWMIEPDEYYIEFHAKATTVTMTMETDFA